MPRVKSMSCSEPHCASCCYQRDSSWTQKLTLVKKVWGAKQKWLPGVKQQVNSSARLRTQASWLGVQARHQYSLARLLLPLAVLLDSQRQMGWASWAMLPVGAELERLPVPPHPKYPCLQSQLALSRLKSECQTTPPRCGWSWCLPVGQPWAMGFCDSLDVPLVVQGAC